MKKILITIPLFLFAGCVNQDNYFTKSLECSKYITQVDKEVDDIRLNTGNSPSRPEVFYSPKLDTCVATWSLHKYEKDDNFRSFEINNLLTNEVIYFKGYFNEQIEELSKQGLTGGEEYEAKKEKLKKK